MLRTEKSQSAENRPSKLIFMCYVPYNYSTKVLVNRSHASTLLDDFLEEICCNVYYNTVFYICLHTVATVY